MTTTKPIATPPSLVEVRRVGNRGRGGRGIFAKEAIKAGTLIERSPVLVVPDEQVFGPKEGESPCPRLTWYVFDWREVNGRSEVAIGLGYLSLYNHAWLANATWEARAPDLITVTAYRDIPAGGEVTINYHGEPDDPEPPAFEVEE